MARLRGESWLVLSIGEPVILTAIYWSTELLIEFAVPMARRISIKASVDQYKPMSNFGPPRGR
ncbi:MAG: hypothetical protein ACI8XM_003137, partial [Haloarculaceae archaeon]